ncbi:ATP-binding cassette domain-containing protein [Estrella lausannensis]|uniref:Uncharacterized ABC transporter ATP-binding protein YbhF n=1 Tax=Estrella lausannensis TaxID=483423 RepID=A0A0H5DSA8_9BACT|nr:ATP-binding cassette domain-containing protein [Estrella lausannensis]CRX38629.1 Uncharacterized ABC transporter ATP-binding protein YbhF [Estrella lausannensis]
MNNPLVLVDNVSWSPPSLTGISASIPRGQLVGLVGPDGAGKTTFLRLLAGLLKPLTGSITIEGKDTINDVDQIHELIGYMPQKFGLYEDLSVIQNLNLYADLRNVSKKDRKAVFDDLLSFTGLKPFTERRAGALSGGMKQKLGLACSLVKAPTLLLLDEPSVGVDPISRRELWKITSSLIERGISILWSTAYLDEAERCDTVLVLNKGRLIFQGRPDEMTNQVRGRVFKLTDIQGSRRALLFDFLNNPQVIDGVIQGSSLRLVMKEGGIPETPLAKVEQTKERFEDAFITLLGGGPGGASKLAEARTKVQEANTCPVVAKELTKKFGSFTAVNNISFDVVRGEIFGLLGPNGAGKTTTFKMLCGLLNPTHGNCFVNSKSLQTAPGEARSHIGYMAQKFSLYGFLNIEQNLDFFGGIYNLKGRKKKEAIDKMVDIFELKPYLNTSTGELPLGFKQRLSLAAANMHFPDILFLDEPTSGVDPLTRREFWNHINGLVEKGVTILITTHFMEEAEYCDRIALVYNGEIIHLDAPDRLKALVQSASNPDPSLEDAFIQIIEEYDARRV